MPILTDLYPSRVTKEPSLTQRQDPVVYSQGVPPKGITADSVKSYGEYGYLFLKSLFSQEEVASLKGELSEFCNSPEVYDWPETILEPDCEEVRSIFRIHQRSVAFDRLARDQRVLNVVRYLLGGDVYIHQSRVNLKPGFTGKEFYWHSDFETWHVEDGMPRMRAVSLSISLTENFEFNGPLMIIPRSHQLFISCVGQTPENHYEASLRRQEYGVPDRESLQRLVDRGGISVPKGPVGSAVFFECNTMHGSNSNITPCPRHNVFVVYNSVSNTLEEPFSGMEPRPEYIASRDNFKPMTPSNEGNAR